jgi:hypothetical protein
MGKGAGIWGKRYRDMGKGTGIWGKAQEMGKGTQNKGEVFSLDILHF